MTEKWNIFFCSEDENKKNVFRSFLSDVQINSNECKLTLITGLKLDIHKFIARWTI